MKKILLLSFVLIFLASCGNKQVDLNKQQVSLPPISTGIDNGVLVGVSAPNPYSGKGPKLLSGTYYFNPQKFFYPNTNLAYILGAYSNLWGNNKVYYYDENDGAQAGFVVYVLRNIYAKKNVSLLLNSNIKKKLAYKVKFDKVPTNNIPFNKIFTGGYFGTGKYLIVYNPSKIKFETGDLLLYTSDLGTAKGDKFFQTYTGVDIKTFDWSKLVDINGNLKSKIEIEKFLKPLELKKYNRVFLYYPNYYYRSGVLALYLESN